MKRDAIYLHQNIGPAFNENLHVYRPITVNVVTSAVSTFHFHISLR